MTVDSHKRGSMGGHSKMKEDAKAISIKKSMDQETFERETNEIRESLSKLMELLQRGEEEQYYVWILRKKKVKWPALQLRQKKGPFIWEELRVNKHEE